MQDGEHVDDEVDVSEDVDDDVDCCVDRSVCRKKIMMILCVLISAPLGTWMGLKYIGIM